jgi:RNA polymerase sigma-70 factor, ECF subfamily
MAMASSLTRRPRHYSRSSGTAYYSASRLGTLRLDPQVRKQTGQVCELTQDFAETSDEELLSRYRDRRRAGDFAELVRRYSRDLSRYLTRYLGDATLAEDVLQETFLLVHAKCSLYREGWTARAWLYTVAVNRAIDALRRLGKLRLVHLTASDESGEPESLVDFLASADPGPLERLQEQERQSWVRQSISQLPEPMRQVLVLTYDRELSYAEIAEVLGIPLGTVKSRLHGAISRLRKLATRQDLAEAR